MPELEFDQWMRAVDAIYSRTFGLGMDDLGDAPWYDYYNDGMTPREAVAHAMTDWQDDFGMIDLEDFGLGGLV